MNNAGCAKGGGLADSTVADVENVFKVNTMSAYIMSQACLPHLLESKGKLRLISDNHIVINLLR